MNDKVSIWVQERKHIYKGMQNEIKMSGLEWLLVKKRDYHRIQVHRLSMLPSQKYVDTWTTLRGESKSSPDW